MAPEVVDRGVVEGADSRVLDGSDHAFSLAIGPRMIGPGQPVLDAALGADPSEDVGEKAGLGPLVVLDELNAVIRQYRVDLVGNGHKQSLEETRRQELRRLPIDPGKDQL